MISDFFISDLGLSTKVILSTLVQAVRYKSGTRQSTKSSPGFPLPSCSRQTEEFNTA
jgi:hypothetical protein